jgi:hypothetical protein
MRHLQFKHYTVTIICDGEPINILVEASCTFAAEQDAIAQFKRQYIGRNKPQVVRVVVNK